MQTTKGNGQRPTFLTVLCILSFIAAGIGIIGMLLASAAKGVVDNAGIDLNKAIENSPGYNSETAAAMDSVSTAFSWPYMILSSVLIIAGLYGVIKMWNLKKIGFTIYAATAAVGIVLPLLFGLPFSVFGLIISGGFVAMYYLNLKHMTA